MNKLSRTGTIAFTVIIAIIVVGCATLAAMIVFGS